MKLCIISDPNSIHTRRWVGWFRQRGHTVWLVADVRPTAQWEPLTDFILPGRFKIPVIKFFAWELQLRQIIQRLKPEILHAHRVSSAGWLGAFSGFHPFVVTPWGSDLYQHPYRSRLAARLARLTLQRADLVTAGSKDLLSQAIAFGAIPSQAHEIGWGLDLAQINAKLASLTRLSAPSIVLNIRAVKPIYNLDVFVKAIPIVRKAFPETSFLIQEYNVDQAYKSSLERLIDAIGVSQCIHWTGEAGQWEDVLVQYIQASIAVSLALTDSMPLSIQEAMACGVPVIASDLASIREWITPEVNGLLIHPQDYRALASAIIRLLSNPELMASFRDHNLRLVAERADRQTEMEKMEALYTMLLPNESDG